MEITAYWDREKGKRVKTGVDYDWTNAIKARVGCIKHREIQSFFRSLDKL